MVPENEETKKKGTGAKNCPQPIISFFLKILDYFLLVNIFSGINRISKLVGLSCQSLTKMARESSKRKKKMVNVFSPTHNK